MQFGRKSLAPEELSLSGRCAALKFELAITQRLLLFPGRSRRFSKTPVSRGRALSSKDRNPQSVAELRFVPIARGITGTIGICDETVRG